jgi:hypothetical protein
VVDGQTVVRRRVSTTGPSTGPLVSSGEITNDQRVAADGLVQLTAATVRVTVDGSVVTDSRSAYAPPPDNREFTLLPGQRVTKHWVTTTTTLSGPNAGAVTTTPTTETHSFEARETITVLGRSHDTCRYTVANAGTGTVSTTWWIVGKGLPARIVSGEQTILLQSGTYDGAPL